MTHNVSFPYHSSSPNLEQGETSTSAVALPPGYYFNPTDKDLIKHYVSPRNRGTVDPHGAGIPCFNIYSCHPENFPLANNFKRGKGNEFYCFTKLQPKEKGEFRINRQVGGVSWDAKHQSTIHHGNKCIGYKKTFSFPEGKPEGKGTGWILHEYSLHSSSQKKSHAGNGNLKYSNHYVLCRIKPPSSHNFTEETVATSNSNKVIGGNENISGDLRNENGIPGDEEPQIPMFLEQVNAQGPQSCMLLDNGHHVLCGQDAPCTYSQDVAGGFMNWGFSPDSSAGEEEDYCQRSIFHSDSHFLSMGPVREWRGTEHMFIGGQSSHPHLQIRANSVGSTQRKPTA